MIQEQIKGGTYCREGFLEEGVWPERSVYKDADDVADVQRRCARWKEQNVQRCRCEKGMASWNL